MPTEVFEDGENLYIGLLEAVPLRADGGPDHHASYPYPLLRGTGAEEMRTFRTILLENPYLRVTIIPGLGGRILSIFDKRTETEILKRSPALVPQPLGPRGVSLLEGIQLELTGPRRNALGNVDTQLDHAPDEETPGGAWIAECSEAGGLSFHQHISLLPDRAEILIENRVFNRTLDDQPYDGGLTLHLGPGTLSGQAWGSSEREVGLWFGCGERSIGRVETGETLGLRRLMKPGKMPARMLDAWTVRLVPYSGIKGIGVSNEEVAMSLSAEEVRVQTASPRLQHKLVLLTEDGKTLEAPADLYPERVFTIDLAGLPSRPVAVALLDPNRQEIARTNIGTMAEQLPSLTADLTFAPTPRAVAFVREAEQALRAKDYARAASQFDQALLYNAEDHLAWWGKSVATRLAGDQDESAERTDLLNAHFLAPLDPVLRAESFLSQSPSMGKEPSPLIAPLADNPENFVTVASQLLEWGLYEQLQRWVDEALRHRDLPILRYLLAYAYLVGSRMEAEAAEQVRAAGTKGVVPTFPYRQIEWEAIGALLARFPDDRVLASFASLLKLRPLA